MCVCFVVLPVVGSADIDNGDQTYAYCYTHGRVLNGEFNGLVGLSPYGLSPLIFSKILPVLLFSLNVLKVMSCRCIYNIYIEGQV